jgi:hypothetical protein
MIKYLKHQDINKEKWNLCISKALNSSVYAISDVLDITSPNWDALVLDDYQAVFPLPWRKKLSKKYIYPPFFSTQLGLFAMQEMDMSLFLNAIPKKFFYQEIKSNTHFSTPISFTVAKQNRTYYLDLSKSYTELVTEFSKNHKQNINKANQNTLLLSKEGEVQPIIDLFRQNKGHLSSFKIKDYQVLHQLISHLRSIGKAEVWSVLDETNTLCAGGFFISDFNKTIFLFSGSNEIAKDLRAMFFLFNQYIKENASKNMVLDFGGSNDDNLARFYAGFGSSAFYYDTICIDKMGQFEKLCVKIVQSIKK